MPGSLRPALLSPSSPSPRVLNPGSLAASASAGRLKNPDPSRMRLLVFAGNRIRAGAAAAGRPGGQRGSASPCSSQSPHSWGRAATRVARMAAPAPLCPPAAASRAGCCATAPPGLFRMFALGWVFCGYCFLSKASGSVCPISYGRMPCPSLTKPENSTWPRVLPVTCPVSPVQMCGAVGCISAAVLLQLS